MKQEHEEHHKALNIWMMNVFFFFSEFLDILMCLEISLNALLPGTLVRWNDDEDTTLYSSKLIVFIHSFVSWKSLIYFFKVWSNFYYRKKSFFALMFCSISASFSVKKIQASQTVS